MDSPKRDLIVVMAGDKSLHPNWASARSFDLWVIYYGDSDEIAGRYEADCDRFWREKGLKIELIRKVLLEKVYFGERFDFGQYRYVFLPDDDIAFEEGADAVHALLDAAERLDADAFQPAVKNEYVSFAATRVLEGAYCHRVNWVENMMPGYRSEVFAKAFLAAVHALEFSKSGWGIEVVAAKIAEAVTGRGLRAYVMDAHAAVHTRPVGQNSKVHEVGRDEEFLVPQLTHNQLRTLVGFRTEDAAITHMKEPAPLPRNTLAIELYMQKVRFVRKFWMNNFEK